MQAPASTTAPEPRDAPTQEDELRAGLYSLLAFSLSRPLDDAGLRMLTQLQGDASALGQAISNVAAIAHRTSLENAADEYQTLFIGIGRGEFVPYASYYLTGFLNEKPLAKLREDMARLGVRRDDEMADPEDHIASLLEMMAGFISGALPTMTLEEQRGFYEAHIGPWAHHFFADLSASDQSPLYAALGRVGTEFLRIEEDAFRMI
ncbi:MAG: molecular chaperone TorD family protein [Pseudomonadota bacterium]